MTQTYKYDLVPATHIATEFGICRRTLQRWVAEYPDLDFPKPTYIRRRYYFSRAAIEAWKSRRPSAIAAE